MLDQFHLRQEAYRYIQENLSRLPASPYKVNPGIHISLEELALLKGGLIDPSAALVAALKQVLQGAVPETEIDFHLVAPFGKIR